MEFGCPCKTNPMTRHINRVDAHAAGQQYKIAAAGKLRLDHLGNEFGIVRSKVKGGDLPERPDWVNVYLLDEQGGTRAQGRELPGVQYTATGAGDTLTPQDFVLLRNYPNPFNPSTTIEWSLSNAADVNLTIYDVRGREIATLVDKNQLAGNHSIHWNAVNQPAGVYFAKLSAGSQIKSIKLVLVK